MGLTLPKMKSPGGLVSTSGNWIFLISLSAILIGYVLWPSLRLFAEGLKIPLLLELFSSFSSGNSRALFNSVWISIWTVIGSGILGTVMSFLFFRYEFPLKKVLVAMAALPPCIATARRSPCIFVFVRRKWNSPQGIASYFISGWGALFLPGNVGCLARACLLDVCLFLSILLRCASKRRSEPIGSLFRSWSSSCDYVPHNHSSAPQTFAGKRLVAGIYDLHGLLHSSTSVCGQ